MKIDLNSIQKPLEHQIDLGNVQLRLFEWPGEGDPVLLIHATGFHSRCWDQVVRHLPGRHIYAVDAHCHGGSSGGELEINWPAFAEDIARLVEQLGLQNAVGVGHSMGGYLIAGAAARLPNLFKQLVLIDPVIMLPAIYAQLPSLPPREQVAEHPVAKRKNNWRGPQQMFERFRDRAPFSSWDTAVLQDYCDYALVPGAEGDELRLACDPIMEASFYLSNAGNEVIYEQLSLLSMPVSLLRAPTSDKMELNFSLSPTWTKLASRIPHCRDVYLPDLNHFIPMQAPELVAGYIEDALNDSW